MALDVTRKLNEIRNKFTLRNLIRSGKIEEATYRMDDGRWVTINGTHVFIENGNVAIGPEHLKSELKRSGKNYSEAKEDREKRQKALKVKGLLNGQPYEKPKELTWKDPKTGENLSYTEWEKRRIEDRMAEHKQEPQMKFQMKQKSVETEQKPKKPEIDPMTADIRKQLMEYLEEEKNKKAKPKDRNYTDPFSQSVLQNLKAEQGEQKQSQFNNPQDKAGGNSTNQRILDILNSDPETLPKPNYAKEGNNNFREKPNRALQHLGENKYADTDPVSVEDIPGLQVSKKTLKRLYEGNLVGLQKQVYVPVNGTKHTQEYIDEQLRQHPDLESYSEHFKGYKNAVKYFVERNQKKGQDSIPDGTYDINTGEKKDFDRGYSVTFHQNLSKNDPLGGYNDKQYATMCAIAMRELKSDGTYVGYFQGSPEISFHCNNFNDAMKFAIEHNQKSIWDCERQAEFENPYYNRKTNPT